MIRGIKKQFDNQLLYFIGYFAWGAVGLLGIRLIEPGPMRTLCLGLVILYGVLFAVSAKVSAAWKDICCLVQTITVAALIALNSGWGVFPILYFILSAEVMMAFSQRKGLLWIGLFALFTAGIFVLVAGWQTGIITSLPYIAGYLFFGIFASAVAQARRERDKNSRLLQELQNVHRKLQDYSARIEELTISEERNRLSREMHDTLGHRLTVVAVQLEGAQRLIGENPEKSVNIVRTAREQIREALRELRGIVATMREPLQVNIPLRKALPKLIDAFEEATDFQVHLTIEDDVPNLTKAYRLTVYRIVQEAFTNIQRHAQAQNIWARIFLKEDHLVITIADDGVGFPEQISEGTFGLVGIRERASHFGGTVHLESRNGGGAQLRVELAVPKTSEVCETPVRGAKDD
ncbi:MAG: hypothetical protein B6I38_08655 [Anaerolineaceae bacterium 4572_5.1]|nr:MAG: hypothetical protein B6I38_08655 [Anaerolineaceae bacterium 4572_5.1]